MDGNGTTKSFNFVDMPCGPEGVDLHGQPYQPFFVPPQALFDQLGGSQEGEIYENFSTPAWKDPVYTLMSVTNGVSGVKLPSHPHIEGHKSTAAVAHVVPLAPKETRPPT